MLLFPFNIGGLFFFPPPLLHLLRSSLALRMNLQLRRGTASPLQAAEQPAPAVPRCAVSEAQPLFSQPGFSHPLRSFLPAAASPSSASFRSPAALLLPRASASSWLRAIPPFPPLRRSPGAGRAVGTAGCQCSDGDRPGPAAPRPLRQRPRLHPRLGGAGGSLPAP